ncbi:hypothetical protein [Thermosulfurimonas marina]|nr:hypothetical protein [Thermosulfurimonas marina]
MQKTNLDIRCAELGRELAKKVADEKVFNQALAVLEEQGPYAMFLYLKARHDKVAGAICDAFREFLKETFSGRLDGTNDVLDAVKTLAEDLDALLFARDLLRTALSYARYHLKAGGGGAS